jgi:hypothetical protein
MTPEQFAYWLQGFAELQNVDKPPTEEQWRVIKAHLRQVFIKVTPESFIPEVKIPERYC